jgi:hypothetical protein
MLMETMMGRSCRFLKVASTPAGGCGMLGGLLTSFLLSFAGPVRYLVVVTMVIAVLLCLSLDTNLSDRWRSRAFQPVVLLLGRWRSLTMMGRDMGRFGPSWFMLLRRLIEVLAAVGRF